MESIDIEDIMKSIRSEKVKQESTDGSDFEKKNPDEGIARLRREHYVAWYHDIQGNPIARAVKKIVRKLTYFMIAPVVEEQNRFNLHNTDTLQQMSDCIKASQEEIKQLKQKVNELQNQVDRLGKDTGKGK